MLTIDILTLFPEMFAPFVGLSIVGRAQERALVNVRLHHILDALEPGERADDGAYGGGPGMVMRVAPLARLLDAILAEAPQDERRTIVLTSPAGRPFVQADAERFSGLDRMVVLCGRYEGIDERIRELYPLEELSLGDFVMTGGEIPALAFLDATIRLLPGVVNAESLGSESFGAGGLDFPSYTRPASFRGVDVPDVLLSGDHRKIAEWRREQARLRTAARRPDL
jgi:tRNA (guanine37-N1)-methyltransferase